MWSENSSLLSGDNSISISSTKHSPFKFSSSVSLDFSELSLGTGRITSPPRLCGLGFT